MMKFTIQIIVALIVLSLNVYPQITLESYIINLPKQELSEKEKSGVIMMREEEKLAQDVYLALFDKWQAKIFDNIASSEKTHTDWVGLILKKYDIIDPIKTERGVYTNQDLQSLYTILVAKGSESLANAYLVGCTIEDLDIKDLLDWILDIDNSDIKTVYQNLTLGSRNHMRSFSKNYSALGLVYKEQFITKEYLESTLNGISEKGPVDENGKPLSLTSVDEVEFDLNFLTVSPSIFSEYTNISFEVKNISTLQIAIYDNNGTVVKNEYFPISNIGRNSFQWNGLDNYNNKLMNGIYYIKIESSYEIMQGKVILLK